ncbi:hypothetical protein [Streptosporangium sp. NPDC002721]|uniref:hypothetical protein n=1 Tax=Streptosporangium sp. NPDC002721 TaxID=3366188 RepID=UPI0036AB3513
MKLVNRGAPICAVGDDGQLIMRGTDETNAAMTPSRKRIRRKLVAAFAGTALLISCGAPPGGAASPRAAVDAYVRGLNARDANGLARLAPVGNDATDEIRQRLVADGGQAIRLYDVVMRSDISPDVVNAHVAGHSTAGRYDETFVVTLNEGRWYIALGSHPNPKKTPASTSRTAVVSVQDGCGGRSLACRGVGASPWCAGMAPRSAQRSTW